MNGTILVVLDEMPTGNPYNTPLNFSLKSSISGNEIWSGTLINPGDWTTFPFGFHSEAKVVDSLGNEILTWKWDPILHGDKIHKFFNAWSIKNKGAFGIAIGTHDGTSGEWVDPVRNGTLRGVLIEASSHQYLDLVKNYHEFPWVTPLLTLVTPEGGEKIFYEFGKGHINSLKLDHVKNYAGGETSEIKEIKKESVSIVDLFLEVSKTNSVRWLHLDTEGIDAELILSLDDPRIDLPEVIIYESLNLSDLEKSNLEEWLSKKGFETLVSGWNTLSVKK